VERTLGVAPFVERELGPGALASSVSDEKGGHA
jgi:hypothetical protein